MIKQIRKRKNYIIFFLFALILFPGGARGNEIPQTSPASEETYFNEEFKFGFRVPAGWSVLCEEKNEKYFRMLKEGIKSKNNYKPVCFLMETKNLGMLQRQDFWKQTICPTISVLASSRYFSLGKDSRQANAVIKEKYRKVEQIFLTAKQMGKGEFRMVSEDIFNKLGELVLKIKFDSVIKREAPTGVVINYFYIHPTQDYRRLHDFLVVSACLSEQEQEYVPKFDGFMVNFLETD